MAHTKKAHMKEHEKKKEPEKKKEHEKKHEHKGAMHSCKSMKMAKKK